MKRKLSLLDFNKNKTGGKFPPANLKKIKTKDKQLGRNHNNQLK